MGFLNNAVKVGSFGLVDDITGEKGARSAADAANAGSRAAIAENRRQFDLTRSDLQPYLDAATGEGGALEQFITGIDQAPVAPELQQNGFNEEFNFDPNSVLDNPNFQFLRNQGDQAANRAAAKSGNLGSGNRLLAAQEFGQGLSTNFLNSEFNQQRTTFNDRFNNSRTLNNDNNNRLLQQHSLGLQTFNDRLNRLGGIVDGGRGTATNLGQIGASSAANIGQLQQNIGNNNASADLAKSAGINNLLSSGLTAAGYALGGPAGGAAAGSATGAIGGGGGNPYKPIGASDARGFFS